MLDFSALKSRFFVEDISPAEVHDSDILFVIAGPCGSGKSTLLRAALKEDLPLFGADLVERFKESSSNKNFLGYQAHELESRKESYFQARHVKLLGREDVLPNVVVLHVDLYQLLREFDPSYWPGSLKWPELEAEVSMGKRSRGEVSSKLRKRSYASMQIPGDNDQLLSSYLQHFFFKRFKRIFVNTVLCDYSVNALQLSGRGVKRGGDPQVLLKRRRKFFRAPDAVSRSIHKEIYASWERNLAIINPAGVFNTQVSESGDLLLNGSILVADWSKRF